MAGIVQQDVLGLEVAVDHVELVQVFESQQKLCAVEARPHLVEPLFSLEVVEELSAVDEAVSPLVRK